MNRLPASWFERWSSGERSPLLNVFGALAYPTSLLYRAGGLIRPPLSKRFPRLASAKLIVVSSPLVGGVGKTPLTATVTELLTERRLRVGIVTMGYGRSGHTDIVITPDTFRPGMVASSGDEAAELMHLTQCAVHVGDSPELMIERLDRSGEADWIVFDDGLTRCWEGEKRVAVIGAADLERPAHHVPYGRWRTSSEFLNSACYVAITGEPGLINSTAAVQALSRLGYQGPQGIFEYQLHGLGALSKTGISSVDEAPAGPPFAFSGIAQPQRFRKALNRMGVDDSAFVSFPDHHKYTADTWAELESMRKELGRGWHLTSLKDAVKIDPNWIGSTPLLFLRIGLHQVAGTEILTALTKDG